jgi:beta-mannanase
VYLSTHLRSRVVPALLALLAATAAVANRPARATAAPIELGAYVPNAPEDARALDSYASMVGRKPDIVMNYSNVTDPLLTSTDISNLEARGETPMVTWQLYRSGWSGPTISLSDIAVGRYDSYLRKAADLARSLPFEVMIRFGHEMNGDWYQWSGHPSAYRDAWRRIVTVFRREGATNVEWVWSPNVNLGSYPFAKYFPGDSWVDYVALDGYNWGKAGVGTNQWQTLSQVFSSSYKRITQISRKPVIIAETSSSEIGGDKATWIRDGLLRAIPQQFPRVRTVVWFNRSMEEDWRLESSQASLQAYRDVVSNSLYGGTDPAPAGAAKTKATVRALQVAPSRAIRAGGAGGRETAAHRAKVVYRLSRRAGVQITLRGRRGMAAARVTLGDPRRRGRIRLSRLVRGPRIQRGSYRVVARAIDGSGIRSKPRRVRFRVV